MLVIKISAPKKTRSASEHCPRSADFQSAVSQRFQPAEHGNPPQQRIVQKLAASILFLLLLAGCGDPGPRALLAGEELIHERDFKRAIEELQKATKQLPRNAQAWNHLGLAHHGAGEVEQAQRAYKEALRLDINLGSARYNLGALALEQNDIAAALEHLSSYTTFQPNSPDGWIKFGNAQARARRPDQAEKCYRNALELRPRDPEALNGLGAIAFQRRRTQDAVTLFNSAMTENPKYAPAVFNMAVVHQSQNNRQQALDELKQYVSLAPTAPNIDVVHGAIEQLESELNPTSPTVSAIALPKTNAPQPAVQTARPVTTNAPPAIASVPRTNPTIAVTPRTTPRTTLTNPPTASRPAPTTNRAERPSDVPVTQLEDDLVVKPPQDVSTSRPPAATTQGPAANTTPSTANTNDSREDKRGLLARLNPFSGRPKATNTTAPEVRPLPATNVAAFPAQPPAPSYPRYRYTSPQLPKAGNRRDAERYFARGVAAQRSVQLNQALGYYQQAVDADPAYFDAYYNLGLAAYDSGRWKQSLASYEVALALKPESIDTRYNFALALKQAGHPLDSAEELKQILKGSPSETRAHLSLANLYAQQLSQARLARQHYLKVLELEPSHPKGAEIRYWLAANP
jgi:tetratricopeptide (TPR) repeat protein